LNFLHNHAKVIVASDFFVVVTDLGVRVLQTPGRTPMANRREYLDFLILLTERHLRMTVNGWDLHYNRLPRREDVRAGRLASWVSPGERGRLTTDLVFADDRRMERAVPRSLA
jgi:hypothetical protein